MNEKGVFFVKAEEGRREIGGSRGLGEGYKRKV